jgi:hypothetical protein
VCFGRLQRLNELAQVGKSARGCLNSRKGEGVVGEEADLFQTTTISLTPS